MLEEPDGGAGQPSTQDERGVVDLVTDQETALGGGAELGVMPPALVHTNHSLTLLTSALMLVELVAKPIPNTMASCLPTNRAMAHSNSRTTGRVPDTSRTQRVVCPGAVTPPPPPPLTVVSPSAAARHPTALHGLLHCFGARSRVLSKPEVVVRAQVETVLLCSRQAGWGRGEEQ